MSLRPSRRPRKEEAEADVARSREPRQQAGLQENYHPHGVGAADAEAVDVEGAGAGRGESSDEVEVGGFAAAEAADQGDAAARSDFERDLGEDGA